MNDFWPLWRSRRLRCEYSYHFFYVICNIFFILIYYLFTWHDERNGLLLHVDYFFKYIILVIYFFCILFYLFPCITLHEWSFPVDIKTHFLFQFLSLASSILNFITTSMLKSRNNFIRNYLSVSLTEQHMATLASIIKDVDKDVKGQMFFYS